MTQDVIRELREGLEAGERNYLRAQGWEETCDYPGSYWLWSKTLPDGRVIACDKSMAISLAEAMEDMAACDRLPEDES